MVLGGAGSAGFSEDHAAQAGQIGHPDTRDRGINHLAEGRVRGAVFRIDEGAPDLDRTSRISGVGTATEATRHAASLYRRLYSAAVRPAHALEVEAAHLHELEHRGESGETPFLALLGLVMFLAPIFLVMLGLALLAAYLVG